MEVADLDTGFAVVVAAATELVAARQVVDWVVEEAAEATVVVLFEVPSDFAVAKVAAIDVVAPDAEASYVVGLQVAAEVAPVVASARNDSPLDVRMMPLMMDRSDEADAEVHSMDQTRACSRSACVDFGVAIAFVGWIGYVALKHQHCSKSRS